VNSESVFSDLKALPEVIKLRFLSGFGPVFARLIALLGD